MVFLGPERVSLRSFRVELAISLMRTFYRPIAVQSNSKHSPRGHMSIPNFIASILLCLAVSGTLFAQTATIHSAVAPAGGNPADQVKQAPKLERFDPELVDKTLDPCNDFYKYACNKWLTANPIPPDQVYWGTGSGLELWNENLLRETLEASSVNDPKRTPVQQKIGDYWPACMDESGIEAAGLKPMQQELG